MAKIMETGIKQDAVNYYYTALICKDLCSKIITSQFTTKCYKLTSNTNKTSEGLWECNSQYINC